MSQTLALYDLQQIDTKLDQARTRLEEIEAALNNDAALKKAQKKAEDEKKKFQKAQLELKHAEENVQEQENKIANNQKTLYSGAVSNPKELEDLQHEAEALKRYLSVLEDRQLEKMVAFEESEASQQESEKNLELAREQAAQQNADLSGEQTQLEALVGKLDNEREAAVSQIDAAALNAYTKLRQTRFGLAVALVEGNICTACGAALTAAQAQAVRSPSKISTCSSCGRILYTQ